MFESSLNNPYLVKSYADNNGNWYRIYSDNWVEQGGLISSSSSVTINLLKPYKDAKYSVFTCQSYSGRTSTLNSLIGAWSKTATTFKSEFNIGDTPAQWIAFGQGA